MGEIGRLAAGTGLAKCAGSPYLPDTEVVRNDLRRTYSNIKEMDAQLGELLEQLEAKGLLDSTLVFLYSDHGGPMPRLSRGICS